MMNSYRRHSGSGRKVRAATALVVVLVLLDIVTGGGVRTAAREGAAALSRAFGGTFSALASSGIFSSRAALQIQNQELAAELQQYQLRAAFASVLQAENDQLSSLARLAKASPGITAPVVSSVISSPYGTFLIGAGSADGVALGSLVLASAAGGDASSAANAFIIGRVASVQPRVSAVAEVFAPGSSINAIIHGASVVLTGSGGGNAYASLPRDAMVIGGDAVLSPDLGGYAVGTVGHVASSSAQALQDVYVSVPVNLGSLQYVYVVTR